jgi:hypothetical protein
MIMRVLAVTLMAAAVACAQGSAAAELDAQVKAPHVPAIVVDLRWDSVTPHRSVWHASASATGLSWQKERVADAGEESESASEFARCIDDYHRDSAQLCDQAFDLLTALPEEVFPASHGPTRDSIRARHLIVPDRQLRYGLQRAVSCYVDVLVNLKSGNYAPLPQIDTGALGELRIAWSGDGAHVAFVSVGGLLKAEGYFACTLEVAPGAATRRFALQHRPRDIAWSEDGRRLAVLSVDERPDPGLSATKRLMQGELPTLCDVYVTVIDLDAGTHDESLVVRDVPSVQGTIMWDPRCVSAPPWVNPSRG